jgi:hypothetical protein
MVKLVDFDEKEGHNRLLCAKLIRARLDVMFDKHVGPDGQVFAGEHDCMLRFGPYNRDIFERVHTTGKPQPKTRGIDVQHVFLLVPFLLDRLFEDHLQPGEPDPSDDIIPIVTTLLDWYMHMRWRGKDMAEINRMDSKAEEFATLCEETFRPYPMKSGKHLMSSSKVHRMCHGGTQTVIGGDRVNFDPMAEIGHKRHIKGPQHLTSKGNKDGPGLLKISERKHAVEEVLCGWQGFVSCSQHVATVSKSCSEIVLCMSTPCS